jgi:hypothetical protein
MPKIVKKIHIASSTEDIWATLSAFGDIGQWAQNVSHSCLLTEQKKGVGAIRRIQQGNKTLTEEVTTWQNLSSLVYEINGLPPVFKSVTNTWLISPQENGTEVNLEIEILPKRRPATPVAALACILVSRFNHGMLSDLKDFLENIKPINGLREEVALLTSRLLQLDEGNDPL